MILTTVIKLLESEASHLDSDRELNRFSIDFQKVQARLNGALLLLYRIRDGSPITLSHEIPRRKDLTS